MKPLGAIYKRDLTLSLSPSEPLTLVSTSRYFSLTPHTDSGLTPQNTQPTTETTYEPATPFLSFLLIVPPRMSYSITAEVYQTSEDAFFHIVEKTVWNYANGGTWGKVNGAHVLTMGGSGTSGSLRFVSDTSENFIITLGVDGSKCWGDIVTNLDNDLTGIIINSRYYDDNHKDMEKQREAHLTSYSISNLKDRRFSFTYTVAGGNNLKVKIVIG